MASSAQTWNFSTWGANSYSSTFEKDGLTVYATEAEKMEIDGNNKTFDGASYTLRMKTGGAGVFAEGVPTARVMAFPVAGSGILTVAALSSSSSAPRVCYISDDAGATVLDSMTILGASTAAVTYDYKGSADRLYVYSKTGGVNFYMMKWEAGETEPSKDNVWSFSNWEVKDYTTNFEKDGITIHAATSGMGVDTNNKTFDGVAYTHRLKTGGAGTFVEGVPARVIELAIDGPGELKVGVLSSSSGTPRLCNISEDGVTVLGTIEAKGENTQLENFHYTGSSKKLYLYSASGGINFYVIEWEGGVSSNVAKDKLTNFVYNGRTVLVEDAVVLNVYNITGAKVASAFDTEVSVERLGRGIYVVEAVMANGKRATSKIVR